MMNPRPVPKAFSFCTVAQGILPDLTRQVTLTPPLLAVPGLLCLPNLFLELGLLIGISPI